jgi:plastocyanin
MRMQKENFMAKRESVIRTGVSLLLLSLMSAAVSMAATHVVTFGGSVGFKYSPSNFNCSVGDTVKWEGSFSTHPLSSTTIPTGAASWHNASGSVFTYAVKVAGTYNYKCDVHSGSGMVGQFTAVATEVEEKISTVQPGSYDLSQNYPNPFNPKTTIRFSVPGSQNVVLTVYNVLGNKVATLTDGFQTAGVHELEFDASTLPSGIYYYKMQAGEFIAVKKLTLIK